MSSVLANLPHALAQTAKFFVLMAVIFIPLELLFKRRANSFLRPQLGADVAFFFVNSIFPAMLLGILVGFLIVIVKPIYAMGILGWVGALPLWLKFPLAIIVGDIGAYWGHRWSHENPLLWSFHKVHHQAEQIDWLVTNRAHPVDTTFLKFSGLAAIYVCGFAQGSLGQGTAVMSIYALIVSVWAFLVHANVNWRFGFLEQWLASPAFHHWHHSNESPESIDKNYAAIFPWIDRVFGTFYLPSSRWPASCGLRIVEPAQHEPSAGQPAKANL